VPPNDEQPNYMGVVAYSVLHRVLRGRYVSVSLVSTRHRDSIVILRLIPVIGSTTCCTNCVDECARAASHYGNVLGCIVTTLWSLTANGRVTFHCRTLRTHHVYIYLPLPYL